VMVCALAMRDRAEGHRARRGRQCVRIRGSELRRGAPRPRLVGPRWTTSGPVRKSCAIRGTPGGARLCPRMLMHLQCTSHSASLPGIHQWHLSVPHDLRTRPLGAHDFVTDGSDGVWTRLAPPARPRVRPVLSGRAGGASQPDDSGAARSGEAGCREPDDSGAGQFSEAGCRAAGPPERKPEQPLAGSRRLLSREP
jgi:hypothetical protein